MFFVAVMLCFRIWSNKYFAQEKLFSIEEKINAVDNINKTI